MSKAYYIPHLKSELVSLLAQRWPRVAWGRKPKAQLYAIWFRIQDPKTNAT